MTLDYYAAHSTFTDPGKHAAALARLPQRPAELAALVRELCLYDVVAEPFYGERIKAARQDEIHLRSVQAMLDRLVELDPDLGRGRPPPKRLVGRCHHHTLLFAAMLRAHGIPARARGGFGRYFNAPWFEDHWVCEYFDSAAGRWVLVDAQLDSVWRSRLALRFDPDDVPRSEFIIAADAWNQCRSGRADASRFGIEFARLRGLWFIAASLVRDLAALNKVELLPWDVWGAQPPPNTALDESQLAFFDTLARLTAGPDTNFAELRAFYASHDNVRPAQRVFNAIRQREESL